MTRLKKWCQASPVHLGRGSPASRVVLVFVLQGLVVGLEAWYNAEVGLALGTVVFGFSPQNSPVDISRVPAIVAPKGWSIPSFRTMTELLGICCHEGDRPDRRARGRGRTIVDIRRRG